jgi:hypothetical protein
MTPRSDPMPERLGALFNGMVRSKAITAGRCLRLSRKRASYQAVAYGR